VPQEDIERLYGLQVQELSVFDSLEDRAITQTKRDNTVLVEVDAFFLPDAHAQTYRRTHARTTIGIDVIERDARRLGYFHHTGYHLLDGDDYDGVLRPDTAHPAFYPHAEFVKRARASLGGTALAETSADLLCAHLLRRPAHSPVSAWRRAFAAHLDTLLARDETYASLYAANVVQQFGANFELLAHYLQWMRNQGFDIAPAIALHAQKIASETMVLQCRLAHALTHKRRDACEASFDVLEDAYERTVPALAAIIL
jgi:hypothetical protein